MNYQNLYEEQLQRNQELKNQLEIIETILRNYIPVIERQEEN